MGLWVEMGAFSLGVWTHTPQAFPEKKDVRIWCTSSAPSSVQNANLLLKNLPACPPLNLLPRLLNLKPLLNFGKDFIFNVPNVA